MLASDRPLTALLPPAMRTLSLLAVLLLGLAAEAAPPPPPMPAYCSVEDVVDQFTMSFVAEQAEEAAGTFDPEDADDPVTVKVQSKISLAGAEIEGALRAYDGAAYDEAAYDSANEYLNGLNAEAAMLYLQKHSKRGLDATGREDFRVYKAALQSISRGEVVVREAAAPGDPGAASATDSFRGPTRLFGRNRA